MFGSLTRQYIPYPLRAVGRPVYSRLQALRYEMFLRKLGVEKKQILVLATITKSGTHFMRFLIANYIKHLGNEQDRPVTAREIDALFPNGWHHAYLGERNYKTPTPLLNMIGLHDIPRSHIPFQRPFWKGSRVLHLYRNPLDYAVSLYMYKYEYYEHLSGTMDGPVQVLDEHLDSFVEMYLSFREAAREGDASLLSMSYEDVVRYPRVALGTTLRWLGWEPVPSVVEKAVEFSSLHLTALVGAGEIWQRNGTPAVDEGLISEFTDMLVRNGSIGKWRDYFGKSDVQRVEKRLNACGVNLYEFVLDA